MSLKPTDNSFKLTFFKKIVAYELNSGHVLIFYPTQVKLSGISGQFFNRELKTG